METTRVASEAITLRPLNLGELLDSAITLYRKNWITLIGISAVVSVPILVMQIIAALVTLPTDPFFTGARLDSSEFAESFALLAFYGATIIVSILGGLGRVFELGAIAIAVSEQYLRRAITIKQAYLRALRKWLALLIASFILGLASVAILLPLFGVIGLGVISPAFGSQSQANVGLAISMLCMCFGSIPLFVIWFALAMRWSFFTQAIVLEDLSGIAGIRRSWRLTKGSFWRVVGILFLLGIFIYVVTAVPTAAIQFGATAMFLGSLFVPTVLNSIVATLVAMVTEPLQFAVITLLYYDLRVRKEGFDLEMLMQQMTPVNPK
ncbi:MAG: glycerophosphoryl diester phosphodiesterase membrane domain-containing protein [Chloroflexi bacterium]|nr:glycerophosphoryl diester phosphodiesterase membrane domain-containing protein [Chloroflexota bacterium]